MKKKIFCKPCKYSGGGGGGFAGRECYHPRNLEDNWFDKDFDTIHPSYVINQHNDCKWFQKKEGG